MTRGLYKYVLFITFVCIYFVLLRETDLEKNNLKGDIKSRTELFVSPEKEGFHKRRKNWKKILLWTDFFISRNVWNSIFRRMVSGECEESRCQITLDRTQIRYADAVLFNAYNLRGKNNVPSFMKSHVQGLPKEETRTPDQIYIFYSMESPQKLDVKHLATLPSDYFNWTMGYRKDSDVVEPFGRLNRKPGQGSENGAYSVTSEELKRKKFATWIASSCYRHAPFLREKFIETFKRIASVDIYGKCGKSCDDYSGINIYGDTFGSSPCEKHVKNYVFYLSLENSLCDDYATEKIFKAWRLGAIPVVFGGANYSLFAPPKSYIDYRDFGSISDLIKYMKEVASNHTLYNKYFEWQKEYEVDIGSPYNPFVCDLCKKLHQHTTNRTRKSYYNIYDWFVAEGNCEDSLENLIKLS